MRQDLSASLIVALSPAQPHRRQALHLRYLRQGLDTEVGLQEAHAHTHRGEAAQL